MSDEAGIVNKGEFLVYSSKNEGNVQVARVGLGWPTQEFASYAEAIEYIWDCLEEEAKDAR